MEKENLIPVHDFCVHHHLEISFIQSLEETGLIEITRVEQSQYLYPESLSKIEMMVRLHQELSIHPEDIDVVDSLINKVVDLQKELMDLKHKLNFYEQLH